MAGFTQPVGFWGHALLVGPQGLKTAMSPDVGIPFSGCEALAAVIPVLAALVPELPSSSTAELAQAVGGIPAEALTSGSLAEVQVRRFAALASGVPPTDYASASERAMRKLGVDGIPRDDEAYQALFRFAAIRQEAFDAAAARPKFNDKYEQLGSLGGGGQFAIDLVKDRVTNVRYIAKRCKEPSALGRILDDAHALQRLEHPHIGPLHELFVEADPRFDVDQFILVTPYHPDDVSLSQAISAGRRFSQTELERVADQLIGALQHVHRQGIIHRDVKPENILIRGEGGEVQTTLIDFGVAKMDARATRTSSVMKGTFEYMAPEQLRSEKITPAVDIFSLGLTLLAMALSEERAMMSLVASPEHDLQRLSGRGEMSSAFINRLSAMVAEDPAARSFFPSASLVVQPAMLPQHNVKAVPPSLQKELGYSSIFDIVFAVGALAMAFGGDSLDQQMNNLLWGGIVALLHGITRKTESSLDENSAWRPVNPALQALRMIAWLLYGVRGEGIGDAFHWIGAAGAAASALDAFWYESIASRYRAIVRQRQLLALEPSAPQTTLPEPSPSSPKLPAPKGREIEG